MPKRKKLRLDSLSETERVDFRTLESSSIPDALASTSSTRFDSGEEASVFFARELDFVKAKTYDKEYPQMTAMNLFPISHDVDAGAEFVTFYSYEKTGMAKIISNYATDLPRADVQGKPTTVPVKSMGSSYGYSVQEMRASRMAGKSLDVRKADASRYQIDYLNNKIAWFGDAENKLVGILSPENDIPLYTIPNGDSGLTSWNDKTADEILADITGMIKQMTRTTKNVETPDTLVIPADVYVTLSTRQLPNTAVTIKSFLEEHAPYLEKIVSAPELQGDCPETNPYAAFDGSGMNVALLFKNHPDKITIENPLPFYQYPLQAKGLEVVVNCEARTAGANIYYPLSLLIAVGI